MNFVDVLLRVQKRKDLEVPITDDNLKALVLVSYDQVLIINDDNLDPHLNYSAILGSRFQVPTLWGGRRGCPGYTFGLSAIEIALARLQYYFDWALPHGVEADDVDLSEIFGLATRKKTALVLVPTANKDYQFQGDDF
ncbi:hypothetical protein GH714_017643 [Hevea brasiliensis]|uniref:Cytochrome P450 n=1 Tax=Hevea brasiliensis TaxID=3981 RepID=A0A6A6KCR3_HEVBR|nr:hypothetical protein GH714_017643 [Hevea brasiliensis]